MTRWGPLRLAALAALLAGCGDDESEPTPPAPTFGWTPDLVLQSPREPGPRGWLDRRGVIHMHSIYSHDGCDYEPVDPVTGEVDEECYEASRDGLCRTAHDFMMLTDHDDRFADNEFPDVLLYREGRGDELIVHDGNPAANWLACPDGPPGLVLAGTESGPMPVGLEHHMGDTSEARNTAYNDFSDEGMDALRAAGAVVLLQHTENWSVEELTTWRVDGFEMFNFHANSITGGGGVISLLGNMDSPERLPHPDLVFVPVVNEDRRYLERWAETLSSGARRVTTMGTDAHANTMPQILPDGERVDSFRRFMRWVSNHLLVRDDGTGEFDDRSLKEALAAGRLWGSFDMFGYVEGFDYHALEGGTVREMGEEASLASAVELRASLPQVAGLEAIDAEPEIRIVLLRAAGDQWQTIADTEDDLAETVTEPGAYRVEVRIGGQKVAQQRFSVGST